MSLVTQHPLIDDVLATWRESLGTDVRAYTGHVYRMFNFARALAGETVNSAADDTWAVAAAFHDLGIWSDKTFDYLPPSIARANHYLATERPDLDSAEITRMIALHHKLTRCAPDAGVKAEIFRRADLVDVSWGWVRFGLPRAFVREAKASFPNAKFHQCLMRVGLSWALRHPTRPLPMLKG